MRSTQTHSGKVAAVVLCAGKGERTGLAYNKVLHLIGKKTALELSLDALCSADIDRITVVAAEADIPAVTEIADGYTNVSVTHGGATRAQSVLCGLKACPCDIVVIHDGARPYVSTQLINATIDSAKKFGSGIAAVAGVDTVKRVGADGAVHSLPRAELFNTQTPQTFVYADILDAYTRVDLSSVTDDAEVFERAGYVPRLVPGEYTNTKITTHNDLFPALPANYRIGIGWDIHRLVFGRPLVLGGVTIQHDKGLLGHSDADALAHAVMDALLSAAGLPDIGVLFPDTDDRYAGISSVILLKDVRARVGDLGYKIVNVSATVVAQQPKLSPYIQAMRKALADALGIAAGAIDISATTTERLGVVGEGNAIAAQAACLLCEVTE